MAYKVFTNGSTLQASEVNDNLMKQAVATFSNAAARTAAITAPVEGQLTYLEDVNLYQHWNGSAWVSPFGSTLVSEVNFTSSAAVSLNNVFTSAYENYIIQMNFSAAGNGDVRFRFRSNGSDYTGNQYFFTGLVSVQTNSASAVDNGNAVTSGYICGLGSAIMSSQMTLFAPNLSRAKYTAGQSMALFGDFFHRVTGNYVGQTTAYDGITIYHTVGTITGNIRVYGMKKA